MVSSICVRLTGSRALAPATDHRWLMTTPLIHPLLTKTSAPVGPADHFPVLSMPPVAVGVWTIGPAPQVHGLVVVRVTNAETSMSPKPDADSPPRTHVIGTFERETRRQSPGKSIGTRG